VNIANEHHISFEEAVNMTQTARFQDTDSVGSIVASFHGASNIFKRHRIDFCCGGHQPLSEAAQATGIPSHVLLEQLEEAFELTEARERQHNWLEMSRAELIDHIVATHHRYLRSELPLLGEFVDKIARVHGPSHPELKVLQQLYHTLRQELQEHIESEESRIFPLLREYEATGDSALREEAKRVIEELEAEHQQAGNVLREIREVTSDFQLPEGACRTYTVTFQKLEELEGDLFQHIHLENNILFETV
jgi:regulator of cell morphogenesis and NO signaling